MTSAKLTLVVAMALIFGQLQCAALCTVSTCDLTQMNGGGQAGNQNVPPCHRHHGDPNKQNPASSCSHGAVIANVADVSASQAHPAPLAVVILPVRFEAHWRLRAAGTEFTVLTTLAPDTGGPSALVLRI